MSVGNEEEETGLEVTEIPLLHRIKMARDELRRASSHVSIDNEVGITAQQPLETNRFLKANHNIFYPRAIEALHCESCTSLDKSREHIEVRDQNKLGDHLTRYETNLSIPVFSGGLEKRLNIPAYSQRVKKSLADDYDPLKEYQNDDALLKEHIHDDVFYIPKKQKGGRDRRDSISVKYRRRTDSESSCKSVRSRRGTLTRTDMGIRPLYRDDIFFQASLHRLPQYKSYGSGLDYTMSVTRLPTWNDVEEEEQGLCQICPEAVRRTLATMLDPSLLWSPSFMLFAISGFITTMGIFTPFMYIADRANMNGMDPKIIVYLVSAIGITNTLGRILSGGLTMIPQVSSLSLNNVSLTIGGLATIFSGISYDPSFQFGFAAIFGLAISFWASLRSIIVVDLIGLEKLTNAFGLLLLFQGLAATIGAPIAGMLMEKTGSYDASFYLSGGLILLSGIICYPLNIIKKWEECRKNHTDQIV